MSHRLAFTIFAACIFLIDPAPKNSGFAQAPNQVLFETSGTIPAQNSQFSGGSRQILNFGPIAVPRSGRLTIVVTASPNVRQEVENITRYDAMVERIEFNGQAIDLRPDYPVTNPPGSNPALATSVWDPPVGGSLNVQLLGPATYNIFGEFSGHAAQGYTLTVNFQPGPTVLEVVPNVGSIAGWETVTVNGTHFEENAVVLFGGVAATDTVVVSANQILCKTPPSVPGATDVVVLVPDPILARWNYGRPWGVFGTLPDGFTYSASKRQGPARSTERLLGTYSGFFKEQRNVNVDPQSRQQSVKFSLGIPGAGMLRWEAWAFIPITGPVFGPPSDPLNFEAFNDSTAVRGFVRGDGVPASTNVTCTSLTYFYAPVICSSTQIVNATGAGAGEFTVLGPARFSALFNDFMSAPFQDWSLALYFADEPVIETTIPSTGPPSGGTTVTLHGSGFGPDSRVFFGDEESSSVDFIDSDTLICIAPSGTQGVVDVSVVILTSLRGTLKAGWRYAEPEPDIDVVDDGEIDALDLIAILEAIRDEGTLADILFILSRYWGGPAPVR